MFQIVVIEYKQFTMIRYCSTNHAQNKVISLTKTDLSIYNLIQSQKFYTEQLSQCLLYHSRWKNYTEAERAVQSAGRICPSARLSVSVIPTLTTYTAYLIWKLPALYFMYFSVHIYSYDFNNNKKHYIRNVQIN